MSAPAVLAAVVMVSACGREDDTRPPEWDYISAAVFQPNCATASCHSRATAAAGLDFSDADRGYTSLTGLWIWIVDPNAMGPGCRPHNGTDICERGDRPLVTPYVPSQSRLVNSLRARGSSRMPPDRPLTEADIALVERWILNGAFREPALVRARRDGGAADAADGTADADAGVGPANDAQGGG
ncbi:MAG: hypothetical protein SF187_11715 [Deltaproteobacteria bacterium]|nr:hypothetical protein [Deltaproteobacteria bacterium]